MVPSTTNSINMSDTSSRSSFSSDSTMSDVSSLPTESSFDNHSSLREEAILAFGERVCQIFHNQIVVLNNMLLVGFGTQVVATTPLVLRQRSESEDVRTLSTSATSSSSSRDQKCQCSNCTCRPNRLDRKTKSSPSRG